MKKVGHVCKSDSNLKGLKITSRVGRSFHSKQRRHNRSLYFPTVNKSPRNVILSASSRIILKVSKRYRRRHWNSTLTFNPTLPLSNYSKCLCVTIILFIEHKLSSPTHGLLIDQTVASTRSCHEQDRQQCRSVCVLASLKSPQTALRFVL